MDARSCLAADGAAIAVAVATARPDEPVPSCPEWTMADLGAHVADVFAFATASLLAADGVRPARPTGVIRSVAEELDRLLAVLDAVDPTVERPTLLGPRPASWWLRRVHHETAVHRFDAMPEADPSTWISAECALDGIDEYLTELASVIGRDPTREGPTGSPSTASSGCGVARPPSSAGGRTSSGCPGCRRAARRRPRP